jgi:hypothetical protein
MPTKTYILWNPATDALAKRGNKFVTHEGAQPPIWDAYPARFRGCGWQFEEVVGTIVDPNHSGPATYRREDSQCARFTKIVAPKDKQ